MNNAPSTFRPMTMSSPCRCRSANDFSHFSEFYCICVVQRTRIHGSSSSSSSRSFRKLSGISFRVSFLFLQWHIVSGMPYPALCGVLYTNARARRKRHKHKTKSRPFFLDLVCVDFFSPTAHDYSILSLPVSGSPLQCQWRLSISAHNCVHIKWERRTEYLLSNIFALRAVCRRCAWMDGVECRYYENWK